MNDLLGDLRHATRSLVKNPGFSAIAILSLAVGLGANTALFSLVNTLLIRPVPGIPGYERAVELGRSRDGRGFDTFTYPDFEDIRAGAVPLQEVAGWRSTQFSMNVGGEGERLQGMVVSANYFDALGVRPAAGRLFLPEEDTGVGEHPVAVLSHRFWERRFDGDPSIIGSTLSLNRRPFTVVGVTNPLFEAHVVGITNDLFVPLMQREGLTAELIANRGASWFQVVGRLAPGATVEEANAAVRTVSQRLAEDYPETNARRGHSVIALGPVPGGGRAAVTGFLAVLMTLVALVLLITCTNVAGMLLARAATREKEIAVRLALGAGRGRLVRYLTTEAFVLFTVAGVVGAAVASLVMGAVNLNSLPIPVDLSLSLGPDWRIFTFAFIVTLTTGLVFGLIPALQSTRPDLVGVLKHEAGRGGSRQGLTRRAFVAGQIGMSLLLLVAAGLFTRSIQRAGVLVAGFDPTGVYMTAVDLDLEGIDGASAGSVLFDALLAQASAIPGVEQASLAHDLPLDLASSGTGVLPQGTSPDAENPFTSVDFNQVSSGYFETLRIPLVEGRLFDANDRAESPKVAVVNRTFRDRVWPGESVLGKTFLYEDPGGDRYTIVGVVENVKNQVVTEADKPFVYTLLNQNYRPDVNILVRSGGAGVGSIGGSLRAAVLEVDPTLSMGPIVSVADYTALGLLPQRLAASVASALGALALLLSGIGIYGVVAFTVARKTREIGIRMALGARRRDVLAGVVRGALGLALPGLGVGLVLAIAFATVIRSQLLGVSPADPLTLIGVSALLLCVVLAGSLVPARRASRTDPIQALRSD